VGADGPTVSIAARSPDYNEVFAWLADDIVGSLAGRKDPDVVIDTAAARLAHWQRFLERSSPEGLSPELQAGLFGELWFLREHVVASVGTLQAVEAWRGPLRNVQDFQQGAWAVEVKTTRQAAPASVRISGERQLQSTGLDLLGLVVIALEPRSGGEPTLVNAIADVRALLGLETAARRLFDDLLISAGYVDDQAHLYGNVSYAIRWASAAVVADGFPRLTEDDLPAGIGDVFYGISIDALKPFRVEFGELMSRIQSQSA
jgi:hypothetical protein